MATHSSILAKKNTMARGAWWATVHGVVNSQTRQSTHAGACQFVCVCMCACLCAICVHMYKHIVCMCICVPVHVCILSMCVHAHMCVLNMCMLIYVYAYILEKAMTPHSSTPAWKIPWTEEPGRLQSVGSLGVGHDRATSLSLFTFMHWRRKWQPTSVFLPGESQRQRSLVGCRLWGRTESDTTEAT